MRRGMLLAAVLAVLGPAAALPGAVRIQFDYTFDTTGFFAPTLYPERRQTLEFAAAYLNRFTDDLSAISASGGNTWEAVFYRPDNDAVQSVVDLYVPADTILVYVGARDLGGSLGIGGPGGYSASGSSGWLDTVAYRGEPGAAQNPATDFGRWGGSIAFHASPGNAWHFGLEASGPGPGQSDFLSVAIHELAHVLGFGTADSWYAFIAGGQFTGAVSVQKHGGPVPLSPGQSHWADGTMSTVAGVAQETAMDPSITVGTRKWFTDLDFAGLDDLGWQVGGDQAVWSGASSTRWDTAGNWGPAFVPGPGVAAVFDAAPPRQPALARAETVRQVDFRTAGWTLGGPGYVLTVGDGGLDSAGAGTTTVRPDVTLSVNSAWTVDTGNTLVLEGTLRTGGRALTKDGAGTLAVTGPQEHTSGASLNVSAGMVRLASDAGGAAKATVLSVLVRNAAVLALEAPQHLSALTLNHTSRAALAPGAGRVLVTKSLTLATGTGGRPTPWFDLADGALVVDYTSASPLANLRSWIRWGFNAADGGYWDGTGLASSTAAGDGMALTAVGLLDNANAWVGGKTAFAGETVDATSVLVKYTYWGDANLDGRVTFDDYDVIDYFYWFPPPAAQAGWWTGDFDYDGDVDFDDYDRIDYAYWFQGGPLGGLVRAEHAPYGAPEPATLALVLAGAAGLVRRRRRAARLGGAAWRCRAATVRSRLRSAGVEPRP